MSVMGLQKEVWVAVCIGGVSSIKFIFLFSEHF